MSATELAELEALILRLPKADRVRLLEALLLSLHDEDEIMQAWIAEAERRAKALDEGESAVTPVRQVLDDVRAKLNL